MSDLKQAASDLRFEKKLSRSFELDPSLVEEDGFSPPNILYFTFNMIDSRIFGIRLGYKDSESQDDQTKYLDVHFNTNKGTVDWSILNHPDSQNQDVMTLRQNLMNLARKLLTEVRPMTKQPVQQSESDLTESAPKAKRQRYEDNIYTLRAEAKKGSNGSEQSTGLDKKPSMMYSNTAKRTPIELPDSETWANLIANYSPQNADVIMERITRFNTLGIGDFTSIASGDLRNKFDARLRINVAKDTARVLLRLCQSESGSKYYQIVDIRRRGQAYR
jgi:putative component of toxin-antitoxin plasmid stabilization module